MKQHQADAIPAMGWPAGWAFDLDDGGAPTPPAPSPAPGPAPAAERKTQVATVAEAVAELERRAAERRAAKKADKAERADEVAAKRQKAAAQMRQLEAEQEDDAGDEADDDQVDDEDADPRRRKPAKADSADQADDDGEDGDDDTEDDGKKKRRRASEDDSEDDGDGEATDDGEDDEDSDSTITVDGRELSIPKGTPKAVREALTKMSTELKADYTRKTQEVAQARQALAQNAQQAQQMAQQALHAQQVIVQMATQMIGQPPPLELAMTDPQQYTIQKAVYEQRMAQLQGLGGHTQQLRAAQEQMQQQQRAQMLQEEAQRMVRALPDLADPKRRERFISEAVSAAAASGFSAQDVAAVGDHRMLHLLNRLIQAERRLSAFDKAGASTKSRLANVPPKVRSSDSSQADQGKGQKAARAKQDFMRSKRSLQDLRRYINATSS